MPRYISQVFIVVEAADESEAADAMSGCLSETLKYGGHIVEWAYGTRADGPGYIHPKLMADEHQEADIEDADLGPMFVEAHKGG